MELRLLRTFRAVVDAGSFTRAAEAMGYAQSSVTAQIQALEAQLGVRLFERLGRRVVLTDAGRRLLSYADRMLRLAEEARQTVRGGAEPAGTLVIGAAETLCAYRLPPVLRAFRQRHPRVHLTFRTGICADLRRALAEGSLDVAFLMEEPGDWPHLVAEPLVREDMWVVAAPEHPLAQRPRVGPADLEGQVVVATEEGCSYRAMFERALAEARVRPAATLEFFSVEAIKQSVAAGLGVALLPAVAVAEEVRAARLVVLPWTGPEFPVVTQVAWHRDKWFSPALAAFVEMARRMVRGTGAPAAAVPRARGARRSRRPRAGSAARGEGR